MCVKTVFSAACVAWQFLFVSAAFFSVLFRACICQAGELSAFEVRPRLLPGHGGVCPDLIRGPGRSTSRISGRIIVTLGGGGIALGPLLISFGVQESGSIGGIIPGLR